MKNLTTLLRNGARVMAGAVFLGAGAFKLVVPFGGFLAKIGVPLPQMVGIGVALLEIGGGAMLLFSHKLKFLPRKSRDVLLRLFCCGLAFDMIFAIALVGAPGKSGRTFRFGQHEIGGETWRLPLELLLLATTVWFALRPVNSE